MAAPETVALDLNVATDNGWVPAAAVATSGAASVLVRPNEGRVKVHVGGTTAPAFDAPGLIVGLEGFACDVAAGVEVWVRRHDNQMTAVAVRTA